MMYNIIDYASNIINLVTLDIIDDVLLKKKVFEEKNLKYF